MRIVVTNDDGYKAKGIRSLVNILRPFGELTVIAPKSAQSGMSMAVSMGFKPIAVRHLDSKPGEDWWYLDGTPASCVKFAIDNILYPVKPDLVVCGINHGNNAATASCYSGTVGAASEGAINGIRSIAVSLDSFDDDADFSAVEAMLPGILDKLLPVFSSRFGCIYNINFPNIPLSEIKGVQMSRMGIVHWENEYVGYSSERLAARNHRPSDADVRYIENAHPEEEIYMMAGDMVENPGNLSDADHKLMEAGYVAITPLNLDNTDTDEIERLCGII
ncbi:MAG: 5'/3'-nucleotidase SurE [Bacteroidales bacterium]|nr:5'/3'-nucleotidase SurE [Bacteroidales bacterium]